MYYLNCKFFKDSIFPSFSCKHIFVRVFVCGEIKKEREILCLWILPLVINCKFNVFFQLLLTIFNEEFGCDRCVITYADYKYLLWTKILLDKETTKTCDVSFLELNIKFSNINALLLWTGELILEREFEQSNNFKII